MSANPSSPYAGLPSRAFWRSAVVERETAAPVDVFQPKFPVTRDMQIVTAGSCFAQHVGKALQRSGFNVVDEEPMPALLGESTTAARYGFGLYSARYSNIYTMRQLLQLYKEALAQTSGSGRSSAGLPLPVWERDGRFFDAQRPGVEPNGLDSAELVLSHRQHHLERVLSAFHRADLFVFTFGLTEAWVHSPTDTVYPTAPGTIAGEYDPGVFSFRNFSYEEIIADFEEFRDMLMAVLPDVKFLITVSPVPLTATASGHHVEVASSYSKSVLRAVCGALQSRFANVDYFPSYEIITSQKAGGQHYEDNLRSVRPEGVQTAMRTFLAAHGQDTGPGPDPMPAPRDPSGDGQTPADDLQCEEALLEGFAR